MKILLIALNARYVHTNLAIRYLRAVLAEQERTDWVIKIKEFSINEQLENIAGEVYEEKPDIIGFSCYIWNIGLSLRLVRRLRPVLPQTYFLVGGPEVSYDAEELLSKYPELDAVLLGEGEGSLPALCKSWSEGSLPWKVPGVVWRFRKPLAHRDLAALIPVGFAGKYHDLGFSLIFTNPQCPDFLDLNSLPNPYAEKEDLQGRLVYVETSRGCPFNCQFCISSTFQGIRYLDPEKFRVILRSLFLLGARTIKFVDRTFNARKRHAFRILDVFRQEAEKVLMAEQSLKSAEPSLGGETGSPRAHCEMAGELLDEEWLEYLQNYPPGMIQLEIGVQSTHQPALQAVKRPQNFRLWREKIRFLQNTCRIPVHLDLIAGLPTEGWLQFQKSFDDVMAVRPDNLQLGFLKVLKGSGLWQKSAEYGLVYSPDPPYTILQTKDLSHGEILALMRIEDLVEKYYNSGRFKYSLEYILRKSSSPFGFFAALAEFWQEKHWFAREWAPKALFENIWAFMVSLKQNLACEGSSRDSEQQAAERDLELKCLREALLFDYYLLERPGRIPEFLNRDQSAQEQLPAPGAQGKESPKEEERIKERQKEEIRNDPRWQELIPEAGDMDRRQWARATAVEYFAIDIPGLLQTEGGQTEVKARATVEKKGEAEAQAQAQPEERAAGVWYLFYYSRKERRFFRIE